MLRKLLKITGSVIGVVVLAAATLYLFFGLRVVMDGGGTPRLRFVESSADLAARIEQHRAEQRAQPTTPVASSAPRLDPQPDSQTQAAAASPSSEIAKRDAETGAAQASAETLPSTPAAYWTDFRGPRRDGVYTEGPVFVEWPAAGLKPIWKQPAGAGYASFVIARNRAFTIEQRGPHEVVAAYDVASGRELWTNVWAAEFRETMGGDGPRATPTWFDGHLYALGATGELRALDDATGKVIWRTNILADSGAGNLPWGMAAAPLVVGEAIVVLPGGPGNQSVVAYDRATGKRLWSAMGDVQAYSSPMLVTLLGVPQIVFFTSSRLVGLTADGSKELWSHPWPVMNGISATQPLLLSDNRLFFSSGYGAGAAVIEFTKAGDTFAVREVWRNNRMKNRFASSVLHEGVIYGLDESILAAIDANTGELKWKGGRYGYGQLLLAGGRLIVLTEDGDLALLRATPEKHEEITRFHVLDGKTWNVPAMAGGYLLVRNLAEMAAFDLRASR
jgi:outer membrane protein assembly factor BamB